eukprot:3363364-Prymnesium_polylepis.1
MQRPAQPLQRPPPTLRLPRRAEEEVRVPRAARAQIANVWPGPPPSRPRALEHKVQARSALLGGASAVGMAGRDYRFGGAQAMWCDHSHSGLSGTCVTLPTVSNSRSHLKRPQIAPRSRELRATDGAG